MRIADVCLEESDRRVEFYEVMIKVKGDEKRRMKGE
jgi:hypothetical protein